MSSNFVDRLRAAGWFPVIAGILGILLLIQLIRLIWLVVTPMGAVGDWRANEVQVLSPQSRLALFSSFDPFFRTGAAQTANVVTSLQLTLYGIRMNEGSGLGSAILAGPDGVQESYSVGEEIMPGVALDAVKFDHVIISRGGVRESLYLDQSIPAETVGVEEVGDPIINDEAELTQPGSVGSTASLADAVDFAPRNVNGKITGIVVTPRGDPNLFKATGLRDGDIIVSIVGSEVRSVADIEMLKGSVEPGSKFSVMVERGADTVPISVNLGSK